MKGVLVSVPDDRAPRIRALHRKMAGLFCGTWKAGTYGVDLRSRYLLSIQLLAQQMEILKGVRLEMEYALLKHITAADRRTAGKGRRSAGPEKVARAQELFEKGRRIISEIGADDRKTAGQSRRPK